MLKREKINVHKLTIKIHISIHFEEKVLQQLQQQQKHIHIYFILLKISNIRLF